MRQGDKETEKDEGKIKILIPGLGIFIDPQEARKAWLDAK